MQEFITIAAQAPIVAIFAWYAWKNNQEWRKYLSDRNSKTEKALAQIVEELKRNSRK